MSLLARLRRRTPRRPAGLPPMTVVFPGPDLPRPSYDMAERERAGQRQQDELDAIVAAAVDAMPSILRSPR